MKDETQKILGEFAFDSLDKQGGVTWEAFAAFFEKFYKKYIDMGYNGCLECNFLKYLTPEAKKWFCEIFSEEEKLEPEKEVFYKIGQRFRKDDSSFLLAICDSSSEAFGVDSYVALININPKEQNCGKRLRHPTKVKNFTRITAIEFKEICAGYELTLIEETEE